MGKQYAQEVERQAKLVFGNDGIVYELRLALHLKPGDAYIANNYTLLHSRTAFEDHDANDRRRHFLRLWLKAHAGRPAVDAVRRFYRHDGIDKREGGGTLYAHVRS